MAQRDMEKSLSLQGRSSSEISEVLGYCGSEEVVHRDNISMTMIRNPPGSSSSELEGATRHAPNENGGILVHPAATEAGPLDRQDLLH